MPSLFQQMKDEANSLPLHTKDIRQMGRRVANDDINREMLLSDKFENSPEEITPDERRWLGDFYRDNGYTEPGLENRVRFGYPEWYEEWQACPESYYADNGEYVNPCIPGYGAIKE